VRLGGKNKGGGEEHPEKGGRLVTQNRVTGLQILLVTMKGGGGGKLWTRLEIEKVKKEGGLIRMSSRGKRVSFRRNPKANDLREAILLKRKEEERDPRD